MTYEGASSSATANFDSQRSRQRVRRILGVLPFVAGVALVLLYSHFLRPIWYDEMVYFVLAGLDNPLELATAIHETTSSINQGQTGIYMALIFTSLKSFGASLLSLRAVSIAFGLLLVATSLLFLHRKGVSWMWQLVFLVLLSGATTLMLFVSEARVYMALASLSTSVLLFYSYSPVDRRVRVVLFGWIVVLSLAVMHPYAIVYLPLLILFGYLSAPENRGSLSLRGLIRWSRPALTLTALALFLAVALATWSRGTAAYEFDPMEWIDRPFLLEVAYQLLPAIMAQPVTLVTWIVVGVAAGVFITTSDLARGEAHDLWAPALLLLLALLATLVISASSLQQGFWILPRQWAASAALGILGFTWLLERAWRVILKESTTAATSFRFAVTVLAVASALPMAQAQLDRWIITYQNYPVAVPSEFTQENLEQRLASGDFLSEKDWIRFAHINTVKGGAVWSEFGHYYRDRDWSDFTVVTEPAELTIYD